MLYEDGSRAPRSKFRDTLVKAIRVLRNLTNIVSGELIVGFALRSLDTIAVLLLVLIWGAYMLL